MAAQRPKKNFPHKFLAFLNVYYRKTNLIKTLNYLDSSRSNGRLSQNPKTGGFREFFLPENDFKTCSAGFSRLSYLIYCKKLSNFYKILRWVMSRLAYLYI